MVKSIQFNKDNSLFPNKKFEFSQLNIIVGENGIGKTKLLDSLMNFNNDKTVKEVIYSNVDSYFWFDSNKHNPIHQDANSGFDLTGIIQSRFKSHGEAILDRILMLDKESNNLIFLDEPESGVSVFNQKKIVDKINKSIKKNNQLFIVTHSIIIIQSFEKVLCLDNCKWIDSKKYLTKVMK